MTLKKLPIGIQTFSSIREDNYLYIDKTSLIEQLTQESGRYFLSRPRRFGKSLLLDTIKELFEGNQALFEGLYLYDKWDWSKTNPVIRIDFTGSEVTSREKLDHAVMVMLKRYQTQFSILCENDNAVDCFRELIIKVAEQYQRKVILLIDEYDKPILDNITNTPIASEVREYLKTIYAVMKEQDAHIRLIFMTGVTKFSKVSLFSGVNQIQDITLDAHYATICGYTQQDLETSFADHLADVDWNMLKEWYNGYNFLGDSVYNPYDILLFISKGAKLFRPYWAETGGVTFLHNLFRENPFFVPDLDHIEADDALLTSFEVERIKPITLLFQTGYLTIDELFSRRGRILYRLKVPNLEVRFALFDQFIDAYITDEEIHKTPIQDQVFSALEQGNLEQLKVVLIRLFSRIPWRNFIHLKLYNYEGYYASVLYAFFASINAKITAEAIDNHGQVDLVVELGDFIYVMEIKLIADQPTVDNIALKQIKEKQYSTSYLGLDKTVFEVGMVFSQTARNLVQMEWNQCNSSRSACATQAGASR